MSEPNPNTTPSDSIYCTTTSEVSKTLTNDSKQNTQQMNLSLYYPAYCDYSTPSHTYSETTFEVLNRSEITPPSIPPQRIPSHHLPIIPEPSISVHLAKELRELGQQLGLTEEDLATLPSSPSLRSATNPNTKLFDESEQRFFDNFLDNIFFDENLFVDNSLPPSLENSTYFASGPSMHTLQKPQHSSTVHNALYNMFSYTNKDPGIHSAPTTPSSLLMDHNSGITSSIENNLPHAYTSINIPDSIESPSAHTRKIPSSSSPYSAVTVPNISDPMIPAKRKWSESQPQRSSSKVGLIKTEKDHSCFLKELSDELPFDTKKEIRRELIQNSQSPSLSSFEDKKDVSKSDRLRKGNKELLTEEEKRANHIASEQKRRNMIRSGFRDLTEIVPSLRDMNNSKSTILFKAVDFIKRLERKNQRLKSKANALQKRLEESQSATMYSLHSGHHRQPPPSGGGGADPSSGGQGYMYPIAYQNSQRSQVRNGNYLGGGTSDNSINQYSVRKALVNCQLNTSSIVSA